MSYVRLELLLCDLAIREEHLDDLLSFGVAVLAKHHAMQARVTVLAFGVDVRANFYQLSDALDVLVDDCDV